jgi:pimeloyl-ACP methyl ester carboxylesterase
VTSRQLSASWGSVRVFDAGNGMDVLYLHGDIGNPNRHPFLEELGRGCRVVAPCLPGFNGSAVVESTSMLDEVVVLAELCDLLHVSGCPVVASSVGAMLALELAAVRPDVFSKMVLIAPMGLWDDAIPTPNPWALPETEIAAMFLAEPSRGAAFFEALVPAGAHDPIDDELDRYRTRRRAASLVWPIPEHGLASRLHRVNVPVHLIWGTVDRITPLAYASVFQQLLPNLESLDVIDRAGHLAEWDAPEEVASHSLRRLAG